MRVLHNIREMDTDEVNSYRIDGRIHLNQVMQKDKELEEERQRNRQLESNANRGVKLTSNELSSLIGQITQTIQQNTEKSLSVAFSANEALNPTEVTRRVAVSTPIVEANPVDKITPKGKQIFIYKSHTKTPTGPAALM